MCVIHYFLCENVSNAWKKTKQRHKKPFQQTNERKKWDKKGETRVLNCHKERSLLNIIEGSHDHNRIKIKIDLRAIEVVRIDAMKVL